MLADFNTPKEATKYATKLLHQHARTCGVHKQWRESKHSAAPHSFILPENKMREWQGEWEQRVLFSHYRHPMRYWGRLVGRALTLLLKEGKCFLPSTAILTTTCVTWFVRRWNSWFSQQSAHPPVELFELDVAEMFPSLDRSAVITALEKFHQLVLDARGKRGQQYFFAINRVDRKLYRVGTGYTKYFTNITFRDVLDFVRYDVLYNDIFYCRW